MVGETHDGSDEAGSHDFLEAGLEDPVDSLRGRAAHGGKLLVKSGYESARECRSAGTHRPMYCLMSARSMNATSSNKRVRGMFGKSPNKNKEADRWRRKGWKWS